MMCDGKGGEEDEDDDNEGGKMKRRRHVNTSILAFDKNKRIRKQD